MEKKSPRKMRLTTSIAEPTADPAPKPVCRTSAAANCSNMLKPLDLAQRAESRPELLSEHGRLLPGREMPALRHPIVVDQMGIGGARPTLRRGVDLVRKSAD